MPEQTDGYWLEARSTQSDPQRVRLAADTPLVFGRDSSCQLQLRDAKVSRRHAEIFWHEGDFLLKDLDSANGTFVNGQGIRQVKLNDGDQIQLGSSLFTYHSPTEKAKSSEIDRIQCQHCGRRFSDDLTLCPGCGAPAA
jgi:pSer/pThr/pTyr-binding forkhead associated (FHA) protein